jgi:hypothetical protein
VPLTPNAGIDARLAWLATAAADATDPSDAYDAALARLAMLATLACDAVMPITSAGFSTLFKDADPMNPFLTGLSMMVVLFWILLVYPFVRI